MRRWLRSREEVRVEAILLALRIGLYIGRGAVALGTSSHAGVGVASHTLIRAGHMIALSHATYITSATCPS